MAPLSFLTLRRWSNYQATPGWPDDARNGLLRLFTSPAMALNSKGFVAGSFDVVKEYCIEPIWYFEF